MAPAATKRSFAAPRTLRAPVAPTALFSLRQRARLSAAMPSQSTDPLFARALEAAPSELTLALRVAGLDDPGILEAYPRSSYNELVAAGVTGLGTAAGTYGICGVTGTGDTSAGTICMWGSYSYLIHLFPLFSYLICVSSSVVCCSSPFSFSRLRPLCCAQFP